MGRLPRTASFEPFFRDWFTLEYFPQISQKLQRELRERSKKEHFVDGLISQFKGWAMGKTESLQATVFYEMVAKYALPARQSDFFFMKTATVNLGTSKQPC